MSSTVSPAGRTAIRQREGCRLSAYRDSVGVWTIGVGHTGRAAPPAVHEGMIISVADADAFLSADLKPFEAVVNEAVRHPLTPNQFDACVSLAFNIGAGAFRTSSAARFAAAGRMEEAADAFLLWTRAGGQVLDGLVRRRQAERAQFLTPDAPARSPPGPPVPAPPAWRSLIGDLWRRLMP